MIRILFHVVKFLNIDTLIRLSHTSKKFSKIREIKFIINSQFRSLVIKVSFSNNIYIFRVYPLLKE
jgi:hypothetical protein